MTVMPTGATPQVAVRRALRTPRSAAVAGIAFSVLFMTGLGMIRWAMPADRADAGDWLSDESRRQAAVIALGLVPFAGIAFLWFIGVVRDRIGEMEDRFFATVFLGSGLLFVGMLFVDAALAASLISTAADKGPVFASSDAWVLGRHLTFTLMTGYAMRMAAVFTIATSTILRLSGAGPRWLATSGYVIALVLLVTVGFFAWVELLFPLWVLVLSLNILVTSLRQDRAAESAA